MRAFLFINTTTMSIKTKVAFYMEGPIDGQQNPTPLAVFPKLPFDAQGKQVYCYSHVGQHSGMDVDYIQQCKPATPEQYAELLEELTRIGYDIEIVQPGN